MRTTLRMLVAAAAVAALAACVPMPPLGAVFISARVGPPRPRVEVIGYAPGPGFVWIRGYWGWDGAAYLWVPGHWDRAPYPRAVWVPDRWRHSPRGWYREEGHWKGNGRGERGGGRDDRR